MSKGQQATMGLYQSPTISCNNRISISLKTHIVLYQAHTISNPPPTAICKIPFSFLTLHTL